MSTAPRDAWLRGPVEGIPDLLMPIAHALVQAREDARRHGASLPPSQLWSRPGGAASAGFHLLHAAGALDRLFAYAAGGALDDGQRAHLALEKSGGDSSASAEELVRRLETSVDRALEQLRRTPPDSVFDPRRVGAAELPTNVLGLLFHGGEHTTRHIGQFITTIKLLERPHDS